MTAHRWLCLAAAVGLLACGGSKSAWVFAFTCLLGQGQFEEKRITVECGTAAGQACTIEAAQQIATQMAGPTCSAVVPKVIQEPTKCSGCPK